MNPLLDALLGNQLGAHQTPPVATILVGKFTFVARLDSEL